MPIGSLAQFDIAKLALAPGDILVVRVQGKVTPDFIERANAQWTTMLPPKVKMLIIDDTIDLEVLTKAEIEERT